MDFPDYEVEWLLSLDGESFEYDRGYKVRFKAKRVRVSDEFPHGINYCLTLHDRHNRRIFGIDNAHGVDAKKGGRFSARILAWDHEHKDNKVRPYEFENPGKLLEYFQQEVEKIINK